MKKLFPALAALLIVPTIALAAVLIISSQPISENDADAQFILGNAAYLDGKYDEARTHYELAIALNPNDEAALSNLAYSYNKLGMYNEAASALRKIIAKTGGSAEQHYNLGINAALVLKESGKGTIDDVLEAITAFKTAEQLSPGIDRAEENIAFLESIAEQYYAKQ